MAVLFSVIIPTLNRCELLTGALESVRAQTFPGNDYEILLIDNGSTDNTKGVIEDLNQKGGKQIRYIYEPRPGLHWARHRAAREAIGDVLAFIDDDAEVIPEWLKQIAPVYEDPEIAAAGGPIEVKWLSEPPEWAHRFDAFGHLNYGPKYKELSWPEFIGGGNFTIRKRMVFDVGGFNPDTAVTDLLAGDGEVGLCRKVFKAGHKIVYVPGALVYHLQKGSFVTLDVMKRRYAQQGQCAAFTDLRQNHNSIPALLVKAVRMLLSSASRKLRAFIFSSKKPLAYYIQTVNSEWALAGAFYYLRMIYSRRFRSFIKREDWINIPERR